MVELQPLTGRDTVAVTDVFDTRNTWGRLKFCATFVVELIHSYDCLLLFFYAIDGLLNRKYHAETAGMLHLCK